MFARKFLIISLITLISLTACTAQVVQTPATATPGATDAPTIAVVQSEPITLRLALADAEGRPSEPYVLEFIEQVKRLSNGEVTIEPMWEAGNSTEAGFEIGVIQLVRAGDADLGLAGSRAFDSENITSFQALQAPFLITNDALAEAVATSDIAGKMLDGLSSAGIVGLTLWPEDLRHPFSLLADKPLLSPEDFAGLNIRTTPSGVSYQLIEALGGIPTFSNDYQGAESGLRQAASLTGVPTATGNVTFFAKYQVLFANDTAFEKLSDEQRAVLRQAAETIQKKAIAEHPSEAEAGSAWCTNGGAVVMASDEQIAALEKAGQPVFDKLGQDPLNAELIAAISELKVNTKPSPGAQACALAVSLSTPPPAENQIWSKGPLPNGAWTVTLSIEDVVAMGVQRSKAPEWAGVYTWTFQDGRAAFHSQVDITFDCEATYEVVDDFVRLTYSNSSENCANEVDDIQWRLDEDGLHFHVVDIKGAPFVENKAVYEAKPWQQAVGE